MIASSSWPVDGRWPGPPSTTTRAGLLEQRGQARGRRPPRRPGGPIAVGSRWRCSAICSAKWVTRTRCGRPAAIPASIAAPTSSTWTWTFQSPSPPTTTSESPSAASALAQRGDRVVLGVEEVHHLVGRARPGSGRRPARLRSGSGCCRLPSGAVTGTGRRPVSTVSAASRITLSPRPPASTTPASRSTWQLLGRARQRLAGRGGRGREHVAATRAPASSAASAAASDAARVTVRMVPSTGVADGGVARVGRLPQRVGHHRRRCARRARPGRSAGRSRRASRSGSRPELPRAPSSAPRPNASSAGTEVGLGVAAGRVAYGVAGGRDGEVHVRAGVAVGHRVDVERVDLLAGLGERVRRRRRRSAAPRRA